MGEFKTTLIVCQHCGRKIMVRAADAERGFIQCTHTGCRVINTLRKPFHYDEHIVQGLPSFGQLTHINEPETTYPLQLGHNIIGTADTCTVQVPRFMHNGRCFISRKHCTLTITFDKWTGQLRYQLHDGAAEVDSKTIKYSLNGTQLAKTLLLKTEIVDVADQEIITLGGLDRFRLTHYSIPSVTLETYKIELDYNPDRTE
ncbi:FHA domain-containing protein [Spirosoma aerophilum]